MSSTIANSGRRAENDDYASPRWTIHRLLEKCELPGGLWFEPCAGAGNIIRAVSEVRSDVVWRANEINPLYQDSLFSMHEVVKEFSIGNALTIPLRPADVQITNPPFELSMQILLRLLEVPGLVVFLQRLAWGCGPRAELFRKLSPSVFVLPERPSFRDSIWTDDEGKVHKSSSDSCEYCFWVFDGKGKFIILDSTPREVRVAEKQHRRRQQTTFSM